VTDSVRRSPAALYRSVGDETVLALPDSEEFLTLSASATELWGLLGEPRTVEELVELIADRYAVHRSAIAADVEAVLVDLRGRGLVEAKGAGAAART
jgi:hypothetical protein